MCIQLKDSGLVQLLSVGLSITYVSIWEHDDIGKKSFPEAWYTLLHYQKGWKLAKISARFGGKTENKSTNEMLEIPLITHMKQEGVIIVLFLFSSS